MTRLERHALGRMLKENESVAIASHSYEEVDGKLILTTYMKQAEIDRLFNSADFKLGWKMCHERFLDGTKFIVGATPAELIKYAGRPKEKT
jgi:hypothetical protein